MYVVCLLNVYVFVAHDEITFYLPVVMLYKQLIDIISTPTQIL